MKLSRFVKSCAIATSLFIEASWAVSTYTVSSNLDNGLPGTLRYVIDQINQTQDLTGAVVNITAGGACNLSSNLPPLLYPTTFVASPSFLIDGSGLWRGLILYPGPNVTNTSVSFSGVSFQNCLASGGNGGSTTLGGVGCGGGGGAGLGGAIFVGPGVNATYTSGNFLSCIAQGGQGGTCVTLGTHSAGGGGGGFAGTGGNVNNLSAVAPVGAGGGGGLIYSGGDGNGINWAAGGGGSKGPGQNGASGPVQAGFGGTSTPFGNAGNGGNSINIIATSGDVFGGGGGDSGIAIGGFGGFGAGGGGGGANNSGAPGGDGGFGGGGGGAGCGNILVPVAGGDGGYGGGGGGGPGGLVGIGGFGGASGKASGAGGGGAGLGGALFVHKDAICNLIFSLPSTLFTTNSVTVSDAAALALGPDIFMMSGASLNLTNSLGATYTMPSAINSDYAVNNSVAGGISAQGTSSIVLSGSNTFTGQITCISGTLSLGATASFSNLNPLVVAATACFDLSQTTLPSIQMGQLFTSGATDGLINIGAGNLGINLFNNLGSFNGVFASTAGGVLSFSSTLSGSATTPFTYTGSSSNFLGTVSINPLVTLYLSQSGNFSATSTLNIAGGVLDVSLLTSNQTIGACIGTGTLNSGSISLTVAPSYSCNFGGAITGSGTLNVLGDVTKFWTLSGSSSFAGTVNLASSQYMRLNGASIPALFNLANLSTLNVQGTNTISSLAGYGNVVLGGLGSSLLFSTSGSSSFYGQLSGAIGSTITVSGSGSLALYGDNKSFNGDFVINGGSLLLKDLGQLPQNIIINNPGTLDISNVGPLVAGNDVDLSNITGSGNVNIGAQNLVFINSSPPSAPFTGGITGSGNITFSGSNTFLLGGNINTTGTIIIDPVGITLSGSASISPCKAVVFVGGTLNAGTVNAVNLYNVSGTGSILAGTSSSLSFINSTASTFSGTLSSNGNLQFSGSSSFSLNTQGSITGSVAISSGTVNLLQGVIFGSTSNLSLLSPATLYTGSIYATLSNVNGSGFLSHGTMPVDIFNGTAQNLSGAINGAGTVTFLTGSATTLLGEFYSSSPLKSLAPLNFQPNGLLILDDSLEVLNVLTMNGTGFVFLNATASASSLVNQAGALIVNGSLSCGSLDLQSNALLGGLGTITLNGTFSPAGLIAPGFNPLAVFGTLSLNTTQGVELTPSSGFEVSFGSYGQDALFIQGTCLIDPGATLIINQEASLLVPYKTYTVIQTTSGVVNQFTSLETNIDPSQILILYPGNSVEVALQAKLIADGNAGKVADVLNQNMMSQDPAVVNLLTNLLLAQSQGGAQNALDQLQFSAFKSVSLIEQALLTNMMLGVIKELEMDAITKYVCSCRLPKQKNVSKNYFETSLFDDAPSHEQDDCSKNFSGHFYLKALGSTYFQKTHDQNVGYKTLDGGLLFGGRYDFAKNFSVNVALAYQKGRLNLYKSRGYAGINQGSIMVLGNYNSKNLELALGYAYGYSSQDDTRKIKFVNTKDEAKNSHSSHAQAAFLKAGLFYGIKETLTLGPYDYLSYIYQKESGFTEHQAGVLDLSVDASSANFIRNELGLRFNHCNNYDTVKLKAFLKAAYVQEIRFNSSNYNQQFIQIPGSFTTSGYMPTRALGLFGVGLNAGYGEDQFDFGFLYDVEACHDYVGQRFELGFSFHF